LYIIFSKIIDSLFLTVRSYPISYLKSKFCLMNFVTNSRPISWRWPPLLHHFSHH